ncbi:MAG: hypothetical protein COB98_05860 [Flavobacteriaceae bacterium]|nr:MAG: hypothetical protein COB98_05860 [Flavobacteriaceae bacterium]
MKGILLMGLPACGKGTQSKKLEEQGYTYIGMGVLLREHKEKGTEIGKLVTKLDAEGKLTPDAIVIKILNDKIEELKASSKGFVFDGVVRTLAQAEVFKKTCELQGIELIPVVISVSEQEATKRSVARGLDSGRIEDSDSSIIAHRIGIYTSNSTAIEKYFLESGVGCAVLKGDAPVDEITKDILALVE